MKKKIIIYQALVRLFGNGNPNRQKNGTIDENGCGKMSDFSEVALRSIRQLGCNYIWYTGLLQQASATDYSRYGIPRQNPQVLKGIAGSPYAISDYYSVSCDLADDPNLRMEEFDALVERTHKVGLKMIIDFVPNHVARQYKSVTKPKNVSDLGEYDIVEHRFNPQNNFYYCGEPLHLDRVGVPPSEEMGPYVENPACATGNDVFTAWPGKYDWYETVKLNFGIDYMGGGRDYFNPLPSTWLKLRDILLYWVEKGVDGFRCDMAFMVPVDFWHWVIPQVKAVNPDVIFIAEIYEPALYSSYINYGGFDYLYDKVGLYDTLRGIVECRVSASAITQVWQDLNSVQSHMLNFLENHDEQRIASDFFGRNPQAAIPALYVSALINGNPYMHYFAGELGEPSMDAEGFQGADGRTTIFDYWGLERQKAWKQVGWDETQLPAEYRAIRARYEEVLRLAQRDAAVHGTTTDLTTPAMKAAGVFAFQRTSPSDQLIVIANFGDAPFSGSLQGHDFTCNAHDGLAL